MAEIAGTNSTSPLRLPVETPSSHGTLLAILIVLLPIFAFVFIDKTRKGPKRPPRLSETIPFVSNAWQFMTDKRLFIDRVRGALKESPIVRCRLGPMDLYLVTGSSNVSAIFRSSYSSDPWVMRILGSSAGYQPQDLEKFSSDKSGGASLPRKGSEIPPEKRIWHAMHRTYDESLINANSVNDFAVRFQGYFGQQLNKSPIGQWNEEVRLMDFLQKNISAAATRAVLGEQIIEVNPGFLDAFWKYEKWAETLAFGLPSWMNREGIRDRERFRVMCRNWYKDANQEFERIENENAEWEPVFGSRISRGLTRWSKSFDFSDETVGAVYALFLFGLHANTVPVITWVMIELIKDPSLLHAIKEEILSAHITNDSCNETLDHQKLGSLPLLQSVYTEAMRLHIGVLITRTSIEPVTIAGYTLPKGSIFQAPTEAAHFEDAVWSTPDHPASEFWAYRHVREVETKNEKGQATRNLEFSLAGGKGSFFPFGGGISICAGRNFAKPEVLLAVAMIILKFELEFVEWLMPDGSPSDRPATDHVCYANAVASPPDREMKLRWRRIS